MPPVLIDPTDEGVVAVGGEPDARTLLAAYRHGIFPWPHEGMPLLWFSPDPRFVLAPRAARLSRSLRKTMRRGDFQVTADTAFERVVGRCSTIPRPGQDGTWITSALAAGFSELHELGLAHSVEAHLDGELVGGLYGLSLGGVFFGESMFADVTDASKVAFGTLLGNLVHWGLGLVDCQVATRHLARFGAVEVPRAEFMERLEEALDRPTRRGRWELELGPAEAVELLAG